MAQTPRLEVNEAITIGKPEENAGFMGFHGIYPLVSKKQLAIEAMAHRNVVSFPMKPG